jgi:RHS repeat-associated protein
VRDLQAFGSGALVDHLDYDGFGNRTESNPTVGDRYGFTGREWDSYTGLQYNRERYYDSKTGRWTSEDPLAFAAGDGNLYRYVGNNAPNRQDPSGLAAPPSFPAELVAKKIVELDDDEGNIREAARDKLMAIRYKWGELTFDLSLPAVIAAKPDGPKALKEIRTKVQVRTALEDIMRLADSRDAEPKLTKTDLLLKYRLKGLYTDNEIIKRVLQNMALLADDGFDEREKAQKVLYDLYHNPATYCGLLCTIERFEKNKLTLQEGKWFRLPGGDKPTLDKEFDERVKLAKEGQLRGP